MKGYCLAILALGLPLAFSGGPAAAQAPNPGAGWSLLSQREVSSTVAKNGYDAVTQPQLKSSNAVSSAVETKDNSLTRTGRLYDRASTKITKERRKESGPKARTQARQGRMVAWTDRWTVTTVEKTTTAVPFNIYDDAAWQERVRTTYSRVYSDKITVIPKGGNLPQGSYNVERSATETGYSDWVPKTSRKLVTSDSELSDVDANVATEGISQVVGTAQAAVTNSGSAGTSGGERSVTFTGDSGSDAKDSRLASGRAGQNLSSAGRAKAKGQVGNSASDFAKLLTAAAGRPDLYAEGEKAWQLGISDRVLMLTPYSKKGDLSDLGISLSQQGNGSLKGKGEGGTANIRSYEVGKDGVTLSGAFRNALQGKGSQDLSSKP